MPLYRAELLAKKPLRYAALIHDVSQVLYLPFDYDDGSYARDRSGYNFHGTIYGATPAAGKIGMGRSFDGTDDYIEFACPQLVLDGTRSWSVLLWFYPTVEEPPDGSWGCLVSLNKEYYVELRYPHGTRGLRFEIYPVGALIYVIPSIYQWYHVGFVYDAEAGMRLYVGGDLKAQNTATGTPDPGINVPYRLGLRRTNERQYKGREDELRFYTRALSPTEIRVLMYRRLI